MLESLPFYIPLLFILTTVVTLCFFYWTMRNASSENTRRKAVPVIFILMAWLIIQASFALIHLYSNDLKTNPPKMMFLGILPAFITIIILFVSQSGRRFIDSLPLKNITWLNIVRIPVEIGLLLLFLHKAVPRSLTFEGKNFDLFAGISAPVVAYFGFKKRQSLYPLILLWNFICLGLVLNVFVTALFSAPFSFQQFSFDQPGVAILYFPVNWLPVFIVPVVVFGHLVSIRQLLRSMHTSLQTDGTAD